MKRLKTGCVRYRRGRWEADFRDANGKRHMEAMSDLKENKARVKVEAQRRLSLRLVEVNAGSYLSPVDQLTFDALAARWLKSVAPVVEVETLRDYERVLAIHVSPKLGSKAARDVKRADIEELQAELKKKPAFMPKRSEKVDHKTPQAVRLLSARTVGKVITYISTMYIWAQSHDLVLRNPTLGVKRLKMKKSAEHAKSGALSPDECKLLFQHTTERWGLAIEFAAYTGLRRGELCGLSWDDVNWKDNTFYIHRAYRSGKFRRFKTPKTEHSVRRVEFPATMATRLKAWKLKCPKGTHNLVFPNPEGNPEDPSNFLKWGLRPALRRAGLRAVRFHDLRHTFASIALAGGVNVTPVSKQLGHGNSSVTFNVYRHALPGEGKGLSDVVAVSVSESKREVGGDLVADGAAPNSKGA